VQEPVIATAARPGKGHVVLEVGIPSLTMPLGMQVFGAVVCLCWAIKEKIWRGEYIR
jgi:hypothetical protein